MSEDVARAVGANGAEPVIIKGKEYFPRPLTIKELSEVERICLEKYRRSYIKTFADNADLLGPQRGGDLIREKIEEAAKWDIHSLPKKDIYGGGIVVNDKIRKWVEDNVEGDWGVEKPSDNTLKGVIATALDSGQLRLDEYEKLTGSKARCIKSSYVNWWVTGTYDGMLTMAHRVFRDDGLSYEDLAEEIGKNPKLLIRVSRDIEHLSVPAVGNG